MTRLIGIAGAMLFAFLLIVPIAAAADPSDSGEPLIIASGADVTLPADQSVRMFIVYDGHARIEGHADSIFVVNGSADLVGATTNGVVAIESKVSIDPASVVSGDIRDYESTIVGADGTTVTGRVRDLGPDMLLGWANLGGALLLMYVAFAVSALAAGVVLAGLAARQLRASTALIRDEPLMVVGAGFVGLIALITVGTIAIVTIVGIPFGLGVFAIVLPGLFLVGYIVSGVLIGEWILGQTSPAPRERPFKAAIIGLTVVGLVSFIPPVGGIISFIGFGAVMLLAWRVLRQAPGPASAEVGGRVIEATA